MREDFDTATLSSESDQATGAAASEESPDSSKSPANEPDDRSSDGGPADGAAPDQPTLFMALLDNFVLNAYAAMGMVGGPYQQSEPDYRAARQMIEILEMLEEKTKGNLEHAEQTYLETHLGDLKLAFVRKSKSI